MDSVSSTKDDLVTAAVIAAFSTVFETALHEHLGHSTACVALGGNLQKMGAYYVDCKAASLSASRQPFVGLAGPVISLIIGVVALAIFRKTRTQSSMFSWSTFFWWHLSTVGFMTGFGYGLFSGFTGQGDLGGGELGLLHGVSNQGLWQLALIAIGGIGYFFVLKIATREFATLIGGSGDARTKRAQRLSFTAYVAGFVVAVLIGLLNPEGIVIVLASAAASTIGGASGLGWMMLQFLDRKAPEQAVAASALLRNVRWMGISVACVVAYAAVFGPTLRV
jgi:hypothetical protein